MAASGVSTAAASSRSTNVTLAALAGLAWVGAGQVLFARTEPSAVALPMWLAGLACVAAATTVAERQRSNRYEDAPPWCLPTPRAGWTSARTLVPAGVSIAASLVAWHIQQTRPDRASRWDLLAVWAIAVTAAFGAVWQVRLGRATVALAAWWKRRRRDVAALAGLTVLGGVPALVDLAGNPWTFNGDEGGFAVLSGTMLDGSFRNPFTVGYLGHPTLYNAVQAGAMWAFGRNVFAARFVCAVLGALAVPLAFVVTTRLVGRRSAGWIAAALLGTFHVHLYWTHSALPNGAGTFALLLVLYLVDRSIRGGGPATLVALGVAVGLAQYGYFSNRLLVPAVAAALVAAAFSTSERRHGLRRVVTSMAVRLGLVTAGFLTATAPLIASFVRHPGQYNGRVNQVSIFSGNWLEDAAAQLGVSRSTIVRRHLVDAVMLPFRTPPRGFYRGDVPFVGWTMAVAGAIGLILVTLRIANPRWTAAAVTWWATTIGMALTTGPADTNRWVLCIPLVCIFSAVGLDALRTVAAGHGPAVARGTLAALVAVVGVACVISLREFFGDANRVEVYSDVNTQVAEHLARDLLRIDPTATVYFAGAPRMYYTGFNDLVFRTPRIHSIEVLDPWTTASPRPALQGTTVFVVLPERMAELDVLTTWYPNGRREDTLDDHGNLLAAVFVVPSP